MISAIHLFSSIQQSRTALRVLSNLKMQNVTLNKCAKQNCTSPVLLKKRSLQLTTTGKATQFLVNSMFKPLIGYYTIAYVCLKHLPRHHIRSGQSGTGTLTCATCFSHVTNVLEE